ncbi:universal stress protein [Actinomadura sp. KC345]|uniref:universal stress protein n=1 Tax=Actinomadura sp. KC345 TaxID=2530371 RepID=UPI0010518677|nr:universal stress protein [Actinomadura sp. KC345]TDC57705.1 universal stress protein [Actinomadura sp. KC345]
MSGNDAPRVLVGYAPDDRGEDALALASLVARTANAPLTVAHVHPSPWPVRGPGKVDAEWVAYLKGQSEEILAQATARLGESGVRERDVGVRAHAHRGSGRGLIEVAGDVGAALIVIGSAPRGRRGRIAIGSTADQLLHGSPVPVLLAQRGFAAGAPGGLERTTVAYWRRRDADEPLRAAAGFAARLGTPMRLVTLVLRPSGLAARFHGADGVLERQVARSDEDLRRAAGLLGGGPPVERLTAVGTGVAKALATVDMLPGEVLVCQSGHHGPLRKVFLGESSGKIVRAAPCPVLVLPRGAGARTGALTGARDRDTG